MGLQAALEPGPRLPLAPHHAVFLEAFDAALELRGRFELQGRAGSDRHRAREGRVPERCAQGPARAGADGLPPHLDDDALDAPREPDDLRGRGHRLRGGARPHGRRAPRLRDGGGPPAAHLQEGRAVRARRRLQGLRAEGDFLQADFPVFCGQKGRGRVPRPERRLRHDRRRHGPRPHRPRLRRGRLPRLPGGGDARARRPPRHELQLHRPGSRVRGPLLQGLRQGHHQAPEGRGPARPPGDDHPLLPVLRPYRHTAHLPRDRRLVREGGGPARPARREQQRRPLDARLRGRQALRQLAQGRARLEHFPQPLLGKLHPRVDQRRRSERHDLHRVHSGTRRPERRARHRPPQALRRQGRHQEGRQDLPPHARSARLLV